MVSIDRDGRFVADLMAARTQLELWVTNEHMLSKPLNFSTVPEVA